MVEVALGLALLASFFFSTRDILVKKSLTTTDLYSTLLITLILATPLTAVIAFVGGELALLITFEPTVLAYFAISGGLQFIVSRGLFYASIGILGASRAVTVIKVDSALSVIFAITLLQESVDLIMGLSIAAVISGVFLVSTSEPSYRSPGSKRLEISTYFLRGLAYAVVAAVGSGLVPLFVRLGVTTGGSPLLGIFVANLFALLLLCPLVAAKKYRSRVIGLSRGKTRLVALSGFFATSGQISKFVALAFAPVAFVAPMLNANLLMTVLFSYLFIQRLERVNTKVVGGSALVVLGITALSLLG